MNEIIKLIQKETYVDLVDAIQDYLNDLEHYDVQQINYFGMDCDKSDDPCAIILSREIKEEK